MSYSLVIVGNCGSDGQSVVLSKTAVKELEKKVSKLLETASSKVVPNKTDDSESDEESLGAFPFNDYIEIKIQGKGKKAVELMNYCHYELGSDIEKDYGDSMCEWECIDNSPKDDDSEEATSTNWYGSLFKTSADKSKQIEKEIKPKESDSLNTKISSSEARALELMIEERHLEAMMAVSRLDSELKDWADMTANDAEEIKEGVKALYFGNKSKNNAPKRKNNKNNNNVKREEKVKVPNVNRSRPSLIKPKSIPNSNQKKNYGSTSVRKGSRLRNPTLLPK